MNGKTILLIEDELFIRELYERVLTQAGFNVIPAVNGQEGVDKASQGIDLILLDIMLPKKNGIDVLKELKENSQTVRVPIILITNLGQGSVIEQAFKSGASGYIMKMKVDPYQIVQIVQKFIDNPSFKMDLSKIEFD